MNHQFGMVPNGQLVNDQNLLNTQQFEAQRYAQPYGQPFYPPFPPRPPRPPRCRWVRECRWVYRCFPEDHFTPYDYGGDVY
ncbi:hypothetical protein [Halalkalibacter alkaliphilus]|uniref:Uncharacterized protein n=1 Tax=Halalkalibacter alkaliphilus TaxID=2917993 RepID=A0A9X2I845_9BACI|nr:hypothetical protein [Halalkalibacter alkaliphilus]MCL7748659.1 hypothetical protein [Halalkalibacter alkaliphilus]